MAILGVETGAFNGSPCGAFTESPLHARGNNIIPKPATSFNLLDSGGGGISSSYFPTSTTNGTPDPNFPFSHGQYQLLINQSGILTSDIPAAGSLLFLGVEWAETTLRQYLNNPSVSVGSVIYAPWGTTAVIRFLNNCTAGKWSGQASNFPLATVSKPTAGGGSVNVHPIATPSASMQIVSADGQVVDVTPGGFNNSIVSPASVPISFDSVALFGRSVPFFPQVTIAGVPDPTLSQYAGPYGIAPNQFYQFVQIEWGALWSCTLQP